MEQADVVAYDSEGELVLVVEVKPKLGTNSEWATRMHRNILAHGLLPSAPFFLLALPDRFYLWKDKRLPVLEGPTYEVDASELLALYFAKAAVDPETVSEPGFELLIRSWLADLMYSSELPQGSAEKNGWLVQSGLYEAIRHGNIASEPVR